MFRILILGFFVSCLAATAASCRTAVNEGCFTDCTYVDNTHLVCSASDCDTTGWQQFGISGDNTFFDRLYEDSCSYYTGSAWIPCTKKKYDGSAWTTTDLSKGSSWILEPVYMLLLDVMPARPKFVNGKFAAANPLPADIDTTTTVTCLDAEVVHIYENYTAGTINAYPVMLRCNTASTWTGSRLFFIDPDMAKAALATLMVKTNMPGQTLAVEFTAFAEYSFLTQITVGAATP